MLATRCGHWLPVSVGLCLLAPSPRLVTAIPPPLQSGSRPNPGQGSTCSTKVSCHIAESGHEEFSSQPCVRVGGGGPSVWPPDRGGERLRQEGAAPRSRRLQETSEGRFSLYGRVTAKKAANKVSSCWYFRLPPPKQLCWSSCQIPSGANFVCSPQQHCVSPLVYLRWKFLVVSNKSLHRMFKVLLLLIQLILLLLLLLLLRQNFHPPTPTTICWPCPLLA